MKYFSEVTGQVYDSLEELEAAEASETNSCESTAEKCTKMEEDTTVPSKPSRKELAEEIDVADERVKEAYAMYQVAKQRVQELSEAYQKQVDEILNPAIAEIKKAETARYEAIKKFNNSFGVYQKSYTGVRAADEMLRTIQNLTDGTLFSKFFRW